MLRRLSFCWTALFCMDFNPVARQRQFPGEEKDVVGFALNEDRPLAAFAGTWTTFNGDRGTKSKPIPGPH